jgi:hypothetical protein
LTKRYQPTDYSYSKIDNVKDCNSEIVKCPVCGNFAHVSFHCNTNVVTKDTIEIRPAYMHTHFILKKNTKIPLLDEGRNVWCYGERFIGEKKEWVNETYKIKSRKELPGWLWDRFEC